MTTNRNDMIIDEKFLTDNEFKPFCEDGELLFYNRFTENNHGSVTLEPWTDTIGNRHWTLRLVSSSVVELGRVSLTCGVCDTSETLKQVLEFFGVPIKLRELYT